MDSQPFAAAARDEIAQCQRRPADRRAERNAEAGNRADARSQNNSGKNAAVAAHDAADNAPAADFAVLDQADAERKNSGFGLIDD